jgi:hypothetical protein
MTKTEIITDELRTVVAPFRSKNQLIEIAV